MHLLENGALQQAIHTTARQEPKKHQKQVGGDDPWAKPIYTCL